MKFNVHNIYDIYTFSLKKKKSIIFKIFKIDILV